MTDLLTTVKDIKMDTQQIANLITLIGVVVAYITLYRQSKTTEDQLKLTERQLQNSIEPVLDTTFDKERKERRSVLTLTNSGSIPIANIRVYAKMSGVFDCKKNEFVRHESQLINHPIASILQPEHSTSLELFSAMDGRLTTHLVNISPTPIDENSILAYTLVIHFRRQSDMKPYYRLVQFEGGRKADEKPGTVSFLLPLRLAPNMGTFSRSPISGELRCRKRMTEICNEIMDLENKDNYG